MKSLRQWKNKAIVEATLPVLDLEKGKVGNELADNEVESGGKILGSPFKKKVESFKGKITELPTPEGKKEGLGELGLKKVSDTTFGKDRLEPGRTPTISQGVPVQEFNFAKADPAADLPPTAKAYADKAVEKCEGNVARIRALQMYIAQMSQGSMQDKGQSFGRQNAMFGRDLGRFTMQNVGANAQPQVADNAMEAVGTQRATNIPAGVGGPDPVQDPHGAAAHLYGDEPMDDDPYRPQEPEDADPTMEPGQEDAPIPGPLDDPKMDTSWGRDVADELRHSGGDVRLRKARARLAMTMQHLSASELSRVENLLKMMKIQGFDEGE